MRLARLSRNRQTSRRNAPGHPFKHKPCVPPLTSAKPRSETSGDTTEAKPYLPHILVTNALIGAHPILTRVLQAGSRASRGCSIQLMSIQFITIQHQHHHQHHTASASAAAQLITSVTLPTSSSLPARCRPAPVVLYVGSHASTSASSSQVGAPCAQMVTGPPSSHSTPSSLSFACDSA